MNYLEVFNKNQKVKFTINNTKYIFGSNYELKHFIIRNISLYFNQSDSEYRKEENGDSVVCIDDDLIHIKRTLFLHIDKNYSLADETKLGTKSLMLKYIEAKLNNSDFFDTINTIDILFKSLSDEFSDEDENMQIVFPTITNKILTKFIKPYYVDEYQKDEFDLSLEKIIILQLKLLLTIQEANLYEDYLILIEVPYINKKIIDLIEKLNGKIIVFVEKSSYSIELEKILLIEDEIIDFGDEDNLYALFSEINGEILSTKEVKDMCSKFLNKRYFNEKISIIDDVKSFLINN